jgi:hypothetical protein
MTRTELVMQVIVARVAERKAAPAERDAAVAAHKAAKAALRAYDRASAKVEPTMSSSAMGDSRVVHQVGGARWTEY